MKQVFTAIFIWISSIVSAQEYYIKAKITGFKDKTIFYLRDLNSDSDIDSAVINNNSFTMKGRFMSSPNSLWLHTKSNDKFYYNNLFVGNENILITGDAKDFPFDLVVRGSKTQDEYSILNNSTKSLYKKRDSLVSISMELMQKQGDSIEIKQKSLWMEVGKIDKETELRRISFIKQNLHSYAALNELFFLKRTFAKDTLQQMYNALNTRLKESKYGKRISTYLKVGDVLKKGDYFSDFSAVDQFGKQWKLSDLRGKYILLDFSTTYCGPCIMAMKDLQSLNATLSDKLAIVSFSGDIGKDTWLKGVKRDNPSWPSLWDGKGTYGETIIKYGVSGYPTFYLINTDGKIINKWSGYGTEPNGKSNLVNIVSKTINAP
ncbi:MAG: DUF4369 domain-containing protein [Sphingobacteriaceae bacterium]